MTNNPTQVFRTLGIKLEKEGEQLLAECPFCGKHKFYVDPGRTVYHCKVCDARGNADTIIGNLFNSVYRKALRAFHCKSLAKKRGIPEEAFAQDKCLGFDPLLARYVWVVRDSKGKATALRCAVFTGKKAQIRNLKGTKLGLLGAEALGSSASDVPVYLCEGEWDRIAVQYLLNKLEKPGVVLGVPGAGCYNSKWNLWLRNRHVICLFDHDDPGKAGACAVYKKLKGSCKSLRFLSWGEGKREGYDMHDLVKDNLSKLQASFDYIQEHLTSTPPGAPAENKTGTASQEDAGDKAEREKALAPISIRELEATFHKYLHLQNCDLLHISLGCMHSIFLPGNPLWLFIVSPPSASKTETLMPISAWSHCHAISNVTSKGLISGFQLQGGSDPSLFATLEGERAALIIKDLTPLLQAGDSERDEVFGILRDAYDGACTKVFGNGVKREYSALHFSLIAGVTPAIDAMDGVAMGERFLKFRADKELEREDDRLRAVKAIENTGREDEMKKALQHACLRALCKKYEYAKVPKPDKHFTHVVSELSTFCAAMRAVAPSDKFSDRQSITPIQEAPPRLATQLTKLAQGLAIHFEADSLSDRRIIRLLKRVVLHTPEVITMRVVSALADYYRYGPATTKQILTRCPTLGRETVRTVLARLLRCNTITAIIPSTEEQKLGAQPGYLLEKRVQQVIQRHRLFSGLPKNDPLWRAPALFIGKRMNT